VRVKAFITADTANVALNIAHDQRPLRVGSQLKCIIQFSTIDILNEESLQAQWRQAFFRGCALSKESVIDPEQFQKAVPTPPQ